MVPQPKKEKDRTYSSWGSYYYHSTKCRDENFKNPTAKILFWFEQSLPVCNTLEW